MRCKQRVMLCLYCSGTPNSSQRDWRSRRTTTRTIPSLPPRIRGLALNLYSNHPASLQKWRFRARKK